MSVPNHDVAGFSGHPARAVTLVLALGLAALAPAADYHVSGSDPGCDDSNPGSSAEPWCSLEKAAETLQAGDTAWIHGGVYHEQLLTGASGSAGAGHITYAAAAGEQPVIDGTGVQTGNNGIIVTHDYIKLIGLEVRNWNDNGIWVEGAGFLEISDCVVHDVTYGVGLYDGTHDFVLNRVEMYAFDLYGFDASPGSAPCSNGVLNDCVAHSARDPGQNVDGFALGHGSQHDFVLNRCVTYDVYDGFDISSANTTLNRCAAYSCWNSAYKVWQDDVTLVNCLGWDCSGAILELDWDGSPGTTTVRNCTFMDAETFTVWVENAGDSLHMYNTIVAGGDNIGLAFEQMGVQRYVGDHNVFHNDNAGRAIAVGYEDEFSLAQVQAGAWATYSGQDASSLVEDAAGDLFVDPTGYDLHLVAGAIAIDAGTSTDAPAEDYEGNPRPQGAGYDIGAFEYGQTTVSDCSTDAVTLCLNNDRFRVTCQYATNQGQSGSGQAHELTNDTGYFWFFNQDNVEVVVKVLEACAVNGNYWVFAGGLTNVQVAMTVQDTSGGGSRVYHNPLGTMFQPIQDTGAFAACP